MGSAASGSKVVADWWLRCLPCGGAASQIATGRKDFAMYLASLDLSPSTIDPIEILSVSGGERQTDSLEVFPHIEAQADGSFLCRFFLHGWRHMPAAAQARAVSARRRRTGNFPRVNQSRRTRRDSSYYARLRIRRLDAPLSGVGSSEGNFVEAARVIRVNAADVPTNRRVLIEFSGMLPQGFQPMSSEPFQLLH